MNSTGETDEELFHRLWAGALFDIISAVHKECRHLSRDEQTEMIYQIVRQLAQRYEPIAEPSLQ